MNTLNILQDKSMVFFLTLNMQIEIDWTCVEKIAQPITNLERSISVLIASPWFAY